MSRLKGLSVTVSPGNQGKNDMNNSVVLMLSFKNEDRINLI